MALLRGINLGPNRRVPMAELRERLHGAGYPDARTYVQSGNIVLSSEAAPDELEAELAARLQEWFGLEIPVVVRSEPELAAVVAADPLGEVATEPKLYTVTFLSGPLSSDAVARLEGLELDSERLIARGRELYSWHPEGIARSKLAAALASARLEVTATARNWRTVTTLLEMARA